MTMRPYLLLLNFMYALMTGVLSSDEPNVLSVPAPPPLAETQTNKSLPDGPIIGAYASWSQCDEKMVQAARDGANVLFWFAINLLERKEEPAVVAEADSSDASNLPCEAPPMPVIQGGPDLGCVGKVARTLKEEGLEVRHMISIGGWNAPHLPESFSATQLFAALVEWNAVAVETAAREAGEGWFDGFDGIDWDLEGHDDPAAPTNTFTWRQLHLMGDLSALAKHAGWLVTMAPALSYLDPFNPNFDLSLSHPPAWKPDFPYHGANTYAYLLARHPDLFDLVSVQLYEGWSHAGHVIQDEATPPARYLAGLVRALITGYEVEFGGQVGKAVVKVERQRLLVGLANGWASGGKFLGISGGDLAAAHAAMASSAEEPRGYMFWDVKDEGLIPEGGSAPVHLAKELNAFLKIRG